MSVTVKYMWWQTCLPIWFIESFPQKWRKHSQQSFTNTPCMVWIVFSWTELLQEQELVREQKGKNYARNWEKNPQFISPVEEQQCNSPVQPANIREISDIIERRSWSLAAADRKNLPGQVKFSPTIIPCLMQGNGAWASKPPAPANSSCIFKLKSNIRVQKRSRLA